MRAEKKFITAEYVTRLNASPFFLVVDYTGLKVAQFNELRTRLLKEPLRLEAGHVLLPEGPGLGIDLDPAAVERYRVC